MVSISAHTWPPSRRRLPSCSRVDVFSSRSYMSSVGLPTATASRSPFYRSSTALWIPNLAIGYTYAIGVVHMMAVLLIVAIVNATAGKIRKIYLGRNFWCAVPREAGEAASGEPRFNLEEKEHAKGY
ncbi:hypothetical protein HPP92_000999 [Vanilla planifolia]|uniref:Uncharacterized protein n=1 Tax=Vanilla planifolia TaxID=51239 RepID=A0A835S2I2_VANPL|nr:hypothetical protein HPP92_000999 [Vanilla planifolia]